MRVYVPSIYNVGFRNTQYKNIIYNTYSGALVALENALEDYLPENSRDISVTKALIEQGFFVDENCDELQRILVQRNEAIFGMSTVQLHYDIATTLKCQAKCSYCFENKIGMKNTMSHEILTSTIEYIKKEVLHYKPQKLHITFFGGEPLVDYDQLLEIGKTIKSFCDISSVDFTSKMITNGIALSYTRAKELKDQVGLTDVQITLDGLRDTYAAIKKIDAFDKVVENISEISDVLKVIVRLNISSPNVNEIKELIEYLLEKNELDGKIKIYLAKVERTQGCDFSDKICLNEKRYEDTRLQIYKDLAKRYRSLIIDNLVPKVRRNYCGLERVNAAVIGPDGKLYKCEKTLGFEDKAIGDVYTGKYYNKNEICYYDALPQNCFKCSLLPVCFGGCPYRRVMDKTGISCEYKLTQLKNSIETYLHCMNS